MVNLTTSPNLPVPALFSVPAICSLSPSAHLRGGGWWRVCFTVLLLWLPLAGAPSLRAQELVHQSHPLSVYLDLRPAVAGDPPQTTPSWIEALEYIPAAGGAGVEDALRTGNAVTTKGRATFRIRLQRPVKSTSEQLQARVFFQDQVKGSRPTVTLWDELGARLMPPRELGEGLDLPSSQTLTLSMHGADYLEISADGDASQIRGVFLSWLETADVLQPSDFRSKEKVRQPFQIQPSLHKRKSDTYLYGVVNAALHNGKPLVLKPAENPVTTFEFELDHQPLVAVVSFEVLGTSIDSPPILVANGHVENAATLQLPDLSDPGYQGISRETSQQLGFRYTGWLRAQKIIPGEHLVAGLNSLDLGLSNGTDAAAIRSVSIQLKYDWEKFDYVLAPPAPAANENP